MLDSSSTIRILLNRLINLLRLEAMIPGPAERAQLAAALELEEVAEGCLDQGGGRRETGPDRSDLRLTQPARMGSR
jgi:hypothetical protein